jgi:hypothetical protein
MHAPRGVEVAAADRDALLVGRRLAARGRGLGRSGQHHAELELDQPPRPSRRVLGRDVVGVQRGVQPQPVERRNQPPRGVLGVTAAPAAAAVAVGQDAGEHGAPAALELLEGAAQLRGVHRLAPGVDPHPPHLAVGPGLEGSRIGRPSAAKVANSGSSGIG